MLELAQQGMRHVGRYVAAASAFPNLSGKPLWDGGRQLLGSSCIAHSTIIPLVGLLNCSKEAAAGRGTGAVGFRSRCVT